MKINLNDSIEFSDSSERVYTDEGFMLAPAIVGRTGIQYYKGYEISQDESYLFENHLSKDQTYAIYRPDAEVFSPDYLESIKGITLVDNDEIHKSGSEDSYVTAKNWKKFAVGEVLSAESYKSNYVRSNIIIRDINAIKSVIDGKNQVSLGYSSELEWISGVDKNGVKYDAIQKNMKANHLAIVKNARAGSLARIADNDNNNLNNNKEGKMIVTFIDGKQIETNEIGASAINELVKARDAALKLADEQTKLADAAKEEAKDAQMKADEADKKIADKEKELADKEEENKKLKAEQISSDEMDKKVADRAETIKKGKEMADSVDYTGLSDDQYRKAVIESVVKDTALKPFADALTAGVEIKDLDSAIAKATFNALYVAKNSVNKNTQKSKLSDSLLNATNNKQSEFVDPKIKAKSELENAWKNK